MDFFNAQDRARRSSRSLVVLYLLATVLIVAGVTAVAGAAWYVGSDGNSWPDPPLLAGVAILTIFLIAGATLFKVTALASGGGRVAAALGGTLVVADKSDPLRQRLRNVVEEMAIASGIPAPEIYVLEAEQGINAFAAGHTPADAAIAVTRGALETLSRDELQGVVAHEFSHILNGDMRLNLRLMGVLFGIMALSLIGRIILRGGYQRHRIAGRGQRRVPLVLVIGGGLMILGWIGVLFARIIKAAVSRQRELLADASAVQFTRQTEGLANALKKIGAYEARSYFRAADPEEVSHMLFARGTQRFTAMFATHPPLAERIRALDPSFRDSDFEAVRQVIREHRDEPQIAAITESMQGTGPDYTPDSNAIVAAVGNPSPRQIDFARRLRNNIPLELYDAAHSLEDSFLLALALVLDQSGQHRETQLHLLTEQLGPERAAKIRGYDDRLREIGASFYLPLLDIAIPVLKRRPSAEIEFLIDLVSRLVRTDNEINLREYCFLRVLEMSLDPQRSRKVRRLPTSMLHEATDVLLQTVASRGSPTSASAAAYAAGAKSFGLQVKALSAENRIDRLDQSLAMLRDTEPAIRKRLTQALAVTISYDGTLTLPEAELLRAVCATLDCPLPPLGAR